MDLSARVYHLRRVNGRDKREREGERPSQKEGARRINIGATGEIRILTVCATERSKMTIGNNKENDADADDKASRKTSMAPTKSAIVAAEQSRKRIANDHG